jgi:arsenate reductase
MEKKNVLVLCTGNSCRSQLAEGYIRHFHGEIANIYSAGVETHGVNPKAIATMAADGIDISGHTSNHVDEYLHIPFDLIIPVCDHASERCPNQGHNNHVADEVILLRTYKSKNKNDSYGDTPD